MPEDQPSATFAHHAWAFLKELAAVVVGAVVVASLLRGFVGQMFLIPSISMQNTLQVSDRVLVEKITQIDRGDVVVFEDPGGWLVGTEGRARGPLDQALEFVAVLPDSSTEHLIKRVVGMPGDHVVCCAPDGRITVNGQPLDETGYLFRSADQTPVAPSALRFDVVVPANRIFVLGDNRIHSRDSRCHLEDVRAGSPRGENAFVSMDLVVGRAVAVVWPLSDAARLPTPATYASLPAAAGVPARAEIAAGPGASC